MSADAPASIAGRLFGEKVGFSSRRLGGAARAAALMGTFSTVASGCDAYALRIESASDVGPVATAYWQDGADARTRVRVDGPDGPWLQTDWQEPSEAGHEVALIGMYPDAAWTAYIEAEGGETSIAVPFETPALPADFPSWSTTGEPDWQGYTVTTLLSSVSTTVILDERGRVVWFNTAKDPGRAIRARLRKDGKGLRYALSLQTDSTQEPLINAVDWRGNVTSSLAVPHFSHDFVEHDDGTLGLLLFDVREHPSFSVDVYGNELVELLPEGGSRAIFSTWNLWDPELHGSVKDDGTWTHGNSLDYDETTGAYSLGFRGTDSIIEVSAATGEVLRQVGGPTSTYSFADEADKPFDQHQFQWVEGGILVFDNHTDATGSRALELTLDENTVAASKRLEITHDPQFWVYAMGDVDRWEGGDTMVTWSTSGVLTEVNSEGSPIWELSTDFGTAFGFLTRERSIPGLQRVEINR